MPCTLTGNKVLPVNSAEAESADVAVWADEAGSVNEEWFRGVCEGCCSVMVSLAVAKDSNPHYQGSACKSQGTASTKGSPAHAGVDILSKSLQDGAFRCSPQRLRKKLSLLLPMSVRVSLCCADVFRPYVE